MGFDNCVDIVNIDFGSVGILGRGEGAGGYELCLTAACPLLLFIRGVSSVGHKPWCIFGHFRLLLPHLLLNTCKGTIKKERQEKNRGKVGDKRERDKGNPFRSPMLAVVFEFVWSTARGGKISNETAPEHTSITGRSRDTCWERKQGKDKKHIQEERVSRFHQWRDSHRSPLLPHSSMGGDAISFMQQACLSTLRMFADKEMHTHWRGDARHTDWILCHCVPRPFACNRRRSHEERWRWRHQSPEERNTSISTPHKIHEELYTREMKSINRPCYHFLLSNAGGRKCRLLMSGALWRSAGRLNRKVQNILDNSKP